jgi:hypothetical protein
MMPKVEFPIMLSVGDYLWIKHTQISAILKLAEKAYLLLSDAQSTV